MQHKIIPLSAIEFNHQWSLHPWESLSSSDALHQSFSRIGILHSPVLLARAEDRFEILCGFKRLQFIATALKEASADCVVLGSDTCPSVLLDTLLAEQSLFRPLSLAEKAKFVEICSRFFSDDSVVSHYLERLQLRKTVSTLSHLKKLLLLDQEIISTIHEGIIQEKMAFELLGLQHSTDRAALVRVFKTLGMGDGKQRKFFVLLRDLAFRRNILISTYLDTPEIVDILNHPVLNAPQKVHHLGSYLERELRPAYFRTAERFESLVRDLHLPDNFAISYSPSFESEKVTLSIVFSNITDCSILAPKIEQFLQSAPILDSSTARKP